MPNQCEKHESRPGGWIVDAQDFLSQVVAVLMNHLQSAKPKAKHVGLIGA
jgi:hypothetical protein